MQKTILVITDNVLNQVNGVVTTFTNIEKQAAMNGYVVKFIDPSLFKHFSAFGYPEVKISIPVGIGKHIDDINPDFIHIATEGPVGLAGRYHCNSKGYNYNTSYHTKFPEFLKEIYGIPENITYNYVRWFHKHSGKVLTTTQTMVDDLKSHGFKSDIIPWTRGVDREHLKPLLRQEYDDITLLYVGRVSKEKGLDDLCKIECELFKYNIQIVGDGPYRKELEEKYPHVNFVGYKKGEDLAQYYKNADVFVFPSRTDTFGIVIIEALAMGTPVAAYYVPGPLDIIDQGITGFMDECLHNAVLDCLTLDRDIIEKQSTKWTWENCWNIFEENLIDK
jgi:glycosyltransferase involved in cell wall biosynthesis